MVSEDRPIRVLHAIHDFLPRHRAGSEIYAAQLCHSLAQKYHVTVVCAEYDPLRRHGDVVWRLHDDLPVIEITNNWVTSTFADTYSSPILTERLTQVLAAVQPQLVHVHNLLNLSFELPATARALGIPVVATLHDYTLVCASGGQRVHRSASHVCATIDPDRCARCFMESPFQSMRGAGTLAGAAGASRFTRLARRAMGTMPGAVRAAALTVGRATAKAVTASDIEARLHRARRVFDDIDLFVAPSSALADEYARLGINPRKLKVSDYGFVPLRNVQREPRDGRLRLGFVGTLVWHKGLHVLIEALRRVADPRVTLAIHGNTSTFPDYVTELRRLAHGLPVEFRGGFDSGRVGEVYGTFDVLVVPSIWPENSPLVIHEAFMAGVPVVGARSGGVAGLISDGHSGLLCEPGNVDSLASAIRRLLDDPSLAARLARGVPPVKSIEQDAAEWDAVYTQLLACKVAS